MQYVKKGHGTWRTCDRRADAGGTKGEGCTQKWGAGGGMARDITESGSKAMYEQTRTGCGGLATIQIVDDSQQYG